MPKIVVNGRTFHFEEYGQQGDPLVFLSGLGGDHRAFSRPQRYFGTRFRAWRLTRATPGRATVLTVHTLRPTWPTTSPAGSRRSGRDRHTSSANRWEAWSLRSWLCVIPGSCQSLILVSTHAGGDPWRKAVIESWVLVRRQVDTGAFTRAVLPWLVGTCVLSAAGPGRGTGAVRRAEPVAARSRGVCPPGAGRRRHTTRATGSARFEVPCLVLVGELDLLNPPRVASRASEPIAGMRPLVVLPGVGHMPHVEDQTRFRQEIERFLDQGNA